MQQRGQLRVLTVADETTGGLAGFDDDVLQGFVRPRRLALRVVPIKGWSELIPALVRGDGDIIAGRFTNTEARRKVVAFSVEVFPTRTAVVTRRPRSPVTTLEQLRLERVGAAQGTSLVEHAEAAGVPRARIVTLPMADVYAALASGQITCVVDEISHAITSQRDDAELQIGVFLGTPGAWAFAVRKEDTALLAAVNQHLGSLRQSPAWSRLVIKHFGESALDILRRARGE